MDANPIIPDLAYGLADIAAPAEGIEEAAGRLASLAARTRPRYLWHVALTTGNDSQAVEGLRRRKYRVYRPVFSVETVRRGRRVKWVRSLFPGYLFVLPHPVGWEPLRESPGMRDLMRHNNRFVAMYDDDPDFRRIEAVEMALRKSPEKTAKFRVGQRVHIQKGPFVDVWGNIEALDDHGRVGVLIDLLKRKVRVFCSEDQLNPA